MDAAASHICFYLISLHIYRETYCFVTLNPYSSTLLLYLTISFFTPSTIETSFSRCLMSYSSVATAALQPFVQLPLTKEINET